jgi:hypothetical protein
MFVGRFCYLGGVTRQVCTYIFFAALLGLLLPSKAWTQGEGDVWFFGDSVLLDFKPALAQQGAMPVSVPGALQNTISTSSSLSTNEGRLIMYTNGWQLFDSNHVGYANWISDAAWSGNMQLVQGHILLKINGFFLPNLRKQNIAVSWPVFLSRNSPQPQQRPGLD